MSNSGAHAHTGVHEDYISISNRAMITEGRGAQPPWYIYPMCREEKQKKHQLFLEIVVESDSSGWFEGLKCTVKG